MNLNNLLGFCGIVIALMVAIGLCCILPLTALLVFGDIEIGTISAPPVGIAATAPPATGPTGIRLINLTQGWNVESMTAVTHSHKPALQLNDQMKLELGIGKFVINYGGRNGDFVVFGPSNFCWTVDSDIALEGAGVYDLSTLNTTTGWAAKAASAPIGSFPSSWKVCP